MKLSVSHGCPRCGRPVPWRRLWGLSWSAGSWNCAGCGARLRVDMDRRSNLTFLSTVFLCALLASCHAFTWYLAFMLVPGFAVIWSRDRPAVAREADPKPGDDS